MQVLVRGVHVDVDEGLRSFVELHLERAAKRWLDKHHHHAGEAALADLPVDEP